MADTSSWLAKSMYSLVHDENAADRLRQSRDLCGTDQRARWRVGITEKREGRPLGRQRWRNREIRRIAHWCTNAALNVDEGVVERVRRHRIGDAVPCTDEAAHQDGQQLVGSVAGDDVIDTHAVDA